MITPKAPYPWQTQAWQQLTRYAMQNRIPHALLLSGSRGLGKVALANAWIELLFCSSPQQGMACQYCRNCELLKQQAHPDMLHLCPEEDSKVIKIDQIREASLFLQQTVHQGSYKVILIHPAEAMNLAAQNALLKSLEEPPSTKTVIILVSSQPGSLAATIRSRCQHLQLHNLSDTALQDYLAQSQLSSEQRDALMIYARGAPLITESTHANLPEIASIVLTGLYEIMQKKVDPVSLAANWAKEDFAHSLEWLTLWITQIIKFAYNPQSARITHAPWQQQLTQLTQKIQLQRLFIYFDQLLEAQRLLQGPTNSNAQMQLETLLIQWEKVRLC